jgi:hypothetical protein
MQISEKCHHHHSTLLTISLAVRASTGGQHPAGWLVGYNLKSHLGIIAQWPLLTQLQLIINKHSEPLFVIFIAPQ